MKPLKPFNLKEFRARHGFNQKEAAQALGICLVSLRAYERSGQVPILLFYAIRGYEASGKASHEHL